MLLSQISQAPPPISHSDHCHLSFNSNHLHLINTQLSQHYLSTHLTSASCPISLTRSELTPTLHSYLPRDDLPRDDLPRDDLPRDDLPRDDLPRDDLPRDDLPRDDLPRDDLPRDDLPRDDLPRDDLPRDDLPRDDLPRDDLPRDDLPRDDLPSRWLASCSSLVLRVSYVCLSSSVTPAHLRCWPEVCAFHEFLARKPSSVYPLNLVLLTLVSTSRYVLNILPCLPDCWIQINITVLFHILRVWSTSRNHYI